MSRQYSRDAARSALGPRRGGRPDGRRRGWAAGAATVLATGLLLGWNPPLSLARQSPDSWSGQRGAELPSGLTVLLDFSAQPGVGVVAEPGRLADRAGGGTAAAYADGRRPGDAAETFRIAEDRPQADGSWRTLGTLRIAFSRAVRNPGLHVSGLAGLATGKGGSTGTATRLTVIGGSPAAPALVARTDWAGWTVDGNALAPAGADGAADGAPGTAAEGSLELTGTFSTATLRIEQRSTARAGSTTAPAPLKRAFTVTLDEQVGSAPAGYTNASHLVSDLFLGADAGRGGPAPEARRQRSGDSGSGDSGSGDPESGDSAAGGPMVELDGGAARRSVFSSRASSTAAPQARPGRVDRPGADPAVDYPGEAAIGRYYRLSVPVATGGAPATLAGWIDFDHNGRFDATERVQAEIPAGAAAAGLEWTVPARASAGDTWARLRLGRDASQLVEPGGFADSGGVEDQRIRLTVGAARPEIAVPVAGATVADARPQISGEGVVAGASVEVREGDGTLCRAQADRAGGWACRPDAPLAQGAHSLTPVETTPGAVVLTGDAVRITVKTTPPAPPAITLPEYTNDPGLLLTGTADPGSTVSVTDRPDGAPAAELCSTSVGPDGAWSCLPVENLADGTHHLTPAAVDAAGNHASGTVRPLIVDTAAPARPSLTAPATGATVQSLRPRFEGRAEPGATVMVTRPGPGAGERVVVCSAVAAVDGSWSCTAQRDLASGDQALVVTATDRAGNGTSADRTTIHVAPPVASPSPSPSAAAAAAAASALPSPSSSPSSSVAASPSLSPTVRPSASAGAGAGVTAGGGGPSAEPARSPSPSPSVSPSSAPSPTSIPAPAEALAPVAPGLLPVDVPAVSPVPDASPGPSRPSSSPSPAPSPSAAAGGATGDPSAGPAVAPFSLSFPSAPSASSASRSAAPGSPAAAPGEAAPLTSGPAAVPGATVPPTSPSAPGSPTAARAPAPVSPTAGPAGRSGAGATGGTDATEAADEAGPAFAEAAHAMPAPPTDAGPPPAHPAPGRRRTLLSGVLLLLAAAGLITRRVFGRGAAAAGG